MMCSWLARAMAGIPAYTATTIYIVVYTHIYIDVRTHIYLGAEWVRANRSRSGAFDR